MMPDGLLSSLSGYLISPQQEGGGGAEERMKGDATEEMRCGTSVCQTKEHFFFSPNFSVLLDWKYNFFLKI